jgi:hypothetical protein
MKKSDCALIRALNRVTGIFLHFSRERDESAGFLPLAAHPRHCEGQNGVTIHSTV